MKTKFAWVIFGLVFLSGPGMAKVSAGGYYWDKAHRYEMHVHEGWHRIDKPPVGYALPDKTGQYGFRAGWLRNTGQGRAAIVVMVLRVVGGHSREPRDKIQRAVERYLLEEKEATEVKSRSLVVGNEKGVLIEGKGLGNGVSIGEGSKKPTRIAWAVVPLEGKTWNLVVAGEEKEFKGIWRDAQMVLDSVDWNVKEGAEELEGIELKSSPGSYHYDGPLPPPAPLNAEVGPSEEQDLSESARAPENKEIVPASQAKQDPSTVQTNTSSQPKNEVIEEDTTPSADRPATTVVIAKKPVYNHAEVVQKLMEEQLWPRFAEEAHNRSLEPLDLLVLIITDFLDRMAGAP